MYNNIFISRYIKKIGFWIGIIYKVCKNKIKGDNYMCSKKVSEVMHLLMAVHMQGEDLYLNQIEEIIDYYGDSVVLNAENNLYTMRAFDILVS